VAISTAFKLHNASTLLDANLEAGRDEKVAVVCGTERVTYGELFRRACGAGAALRDLSVKPGERVLLVMDDCVDFSAVFLGAIRVGAVPVPVNPLYAASEYGYFVADSGASVAVVDAVCAEKVTAPHVVRAGELRQTDDLPPAPTRPDDTAFWLYSSGSTGKPKGVVHRQRDMLVTCETYAKQVLGVREDDVTFSTTKLFHAYGLGNSLSFPYWAGASAVLLSGRPTPDAVFETVLRERPTVVFSVPTLYNAMLHVDSTGQDWSSVRLCVSAAEPLPAEVWHRWHERHGLGILDGIGSTEMLHIYCSNRPGRCLAGSSGTPVPGYEVKLCDDEGRELRGEVSGDLYARGDSMLAGYWNQPEKTADCIREGWFYTRDRYRRDADGNYWYEGRADDMFKVSGLWVSPADVEARLIEHPAVIEAAVVATHVPRRCARGGVTGFLRRAAAPLPGPSACRVRGQPSEDRHREDPAVQAARSLMLDGRTLVDAHVHLARTPTLKISWGDWVMGRRADGDPADLYDDEGSPVPSRFAAFLEGEGVDCAILFAEYSPRVTGIQSIEDMFAVADRDPVRIRVAANVNPHLHYPVAAEVERQLDLGAVALKVHPVHGGFPANARELYPAYAVCRERAVPVIFHCGTSNFAGAVNRFADPIFAEDVAKDFPDLTIVLAHGGRGWWYDAAAFLALMREKVWIEVSGLPPRKLPEYYARHDLARLGRKFIFGTDWPGVPGIRANAEAIVGLGFADDILAGILADNARAVYSLADLPS
jgi:benzoate-CoA ligase family protein